MTLRASAALLAAALLAPSAASAETRFAILVGHNVGDMHEVPLKWAETDATRMLSVLTQLGNVREDRAQLLLAPTKRDLERALLRMEGRLAEANDRGEHTVLFFYFSGHADREELHLATDKIKIDEIETMLEKGPAKTVVSIVDACQNDRTPRSATKGAVRAPSFSWPSEGNTSPDGMVRIRSASAGEVAQESDDLQGSLFTHHLLSGMRGSADLDRDGTVTLSEVYRYGYSRTLADSHGGTTAVQHGKLDVELEGRGALVFSYPRRAVSSLVFGEDMRGHLLVIDDASGRIVAETSALDGRESRLAVAPGKYRLQLRGDGEVYSGLVSLGTGERRVSKSKLSKQEVLAVLTKGPSYDPHPFVLSAGAQVGRSNVADFDSAAGARLGFDYRLNAVFRAALTLDIGYAAIENQLWRYQQAEIAAMTGVDWTNQLGSTLVFTFGVRGGIAAVVQQGDRLDDERLRATGYGDETLTSSSRALGPRIGAAIGAEYHPWSQVGWRLALEPTATWIEDRSGTTLRYGATGSLVVMVRL